MSKQHAHLFVVWKREKQTKSYWVIFSWKLLKKKKGKKSSPSRGAPADQRAKTRLQLLKGVLQNWTKQKPLDFHSNHWQALKERQQAHVDPDERGMKILQRHGALGLPTALPLPTGQMNFSASAPFKNCAINSWKEPGNLSSTKFISTWNIFDSVCVVKRVLFYQVGKLDFSRMSPNEDHGSCDGCSLTVASEKAVGNPCALFPAFSPETLSPLFTWGVVVMGNNFLWASSHGDVTEAVTQMRFSQWGAETWHHKRSNQTFWPLAISIVWKIIWWCFQKGWKYT